MAISASTFLSDSVLFIRDDLATNITDPITATRKSGSRFVMTSYPQNAVEYPIITVKHDGSYELKPMGFRSEGKIVALPMEVRVWARNIKEKDYLTQEIITQLRTNQFGANSSTEFELHGFKFKSAVDVDEPGEQGIKSKVILVEYTAVIN